MKYTVEAQRVLDRTIALSEDLKHNYVGSDHLMVSLLSSEGTEAHAILHMLGVPADRLKQKVEERFPPPSIDRASRPFVPQLRALLDEAHKNAMRRDQGPIGTEDLFCALALSNGPPGKILSEAVMEAGRGNAYTICATADMFSRIGQVFRDKEAYKNGT